MINRLHGKFCTETALKQLKPEKITTQAAHLRTDDSFSEGRKRPTASTELRSFAFANYNLGEGTTCF